MLIGSAATLGNTPSSVSLTISSGDDRYLFVHTNNTGASELTDVQYDGVAFDDAIAGPVGSGDPQGHAYGWIAPPVGTADITWTSVAQRRSVTATAWSGVNQTTAYRTPSTNTATAATGISTSSISSASGDMLVDGVATAGGGDVTPDGSQTQGPQTGTNTSGVERNEQSYLASSGSSGTMGWTLGSNTNWAHIAISLIPAAAGGGASVAALAARSTVTIGGGAQA